MRNAQFARCHDLWDGFNTRWIAVFSLARIPSFSLSTQARRRSSVSNLLRRRAWVGQWKEHLIRRNTFRWLNLTGRVHCQRLFFHNLCESGVKLRMTSERSNICRTGDNQSFRDLGEVEHHTIYCFVWPLRGRLRSEKLISTKKWLRRVTSWFAWIMKQC